MHVYVRIRTTRDISPPVAFPVYVRVRVDTVHRLLAKCFVGLSSTVRDDTYNSSTNVDKLQRLCRTIATAAHREPARRGLFLSWPRRAPASSLAPGSTGRKFSLIRNFENFNAHLSNHCYLSDKHIFLYNFQCPSNAFSSIAYSNVAQRARRALFLEAASRARRASSPCTERPKRSNSVKL